MKGCDERDRDFQWGGRSVARVPRFRPVLVIDLLDEDLDLLGRYSVRLDERLGDRGDERPLLRERSRRLLHGHDRHYAATLLLRRVLERGCPRESKGEVGDTSSARRT